MRLSISVLTYNTCLQVGLMTLVMTIGCRLGTYTRHKELGPWGPTVSPGWKCY
jgi:hypothetical protein